MYDITKKFQLYIKLTKLQDLYLNLN